MSSERLAYRSIGSDGEPWPDWIRALRASSGVYVIRDPATMEGLYVGSSKGRLYDTITRHFQQWKRNKKWQGGQYGSGHDPGMTYRRSRSHVAVRITGRDDALELESDLIERLRPRDNLVQNTDGRELEDAPF